ncbi:hypothetical protein AURDEDRAFT_75382 [Auricularia subglabra TFB-10046 SS5]|nr:hypothetical protein AURDEDRAFT_75382 [Auricularia subglabra TFB-10046 SS5]
MGVPGVVVVYTELGPNTTEEEYHEMYEEDHCPPRMALPEFVAGVRYRAADGLKPTWAGLFHVSDVDVASSPAVQAITANRSDRETRISADYTGADRRLYRLMRLWETSSWPSLSRITTPPRYAMLFSAPERMRLTDVVGEEIEKWHNEDHLARIRAVPGWMRTRRYLLVGGARTGPMFDKQEGGIPTVLTIHEWESENAFASEEFEKVIHGDPRRDAIIKASTNLERRIFKVHQVLV